MRSSTGFKARSPGAPEAARFGAVTFIHRFGSALNANLHFHCAVIDVVFGATAAPFGAQGEGAHFHEASTLRDEDIAAVQRTVRVRVLRRRTRATRRMPTPEPHHPPRLALPPRTAFTPQITAQPSDEILPTPSPLTTRVETPILEYERCLSAVMQVRSVVVQ